MSAHKINATRLVDGFFHFKNHRSCSALQKKMYAMFSSFRLFSAYLIQIIVVILFFQQHEIGA